MTKNRETRGKTVRVGRSAFVIGNPGSLCVSRDITWVDHLAHVVLGKISLHLSVILK